MKPLNSHRDITGDSRLYVPHQEGWEAHVKRGWDKQYCYAKNPQEDYFHLLMSGEIYLQSGHEMYCLTCALRQGIITTERLYWQKGETAGETLPEGA